MKQNKSNYVYKVCTNNFIFANLESAVSEAYSSIMVMLTQDIKTTAPIVTKINGGYMVTVIANTGKVYTRQIDVFKPYDLKVKSNYTKPRYKDRGWALRGEDFIDEDEW